MRVISGSARGRKLLAPQESDVRPMLDRVKESLFNILRDRVEETRVLDLFSGSGSLGIEALSRGAAACVFMEQDATLLKYIRRNLEATGLDAAAMVIKGNVMMGPRQDAMGRGPFDLVLCDPPYRFIEDPTVRAEVCNVLEKWVECGALTPGAMLVIHHGPPATILWPFRTLVRTDSRTYGKSILNFFKRKTGMAPPGVPADDETRHD